MANLNYARMIEEIYFEAKKKHEKYSYLSVNMSMPTLKITDSNDIESSDTNVSQEVFELNQPITDNSSEQITISRPSNDVKNDSMKIANTILDEVHKIWTCSKNVQTQISKINHLNAFNFVGYMITVSDTGTVLGDMYKYITSTDIKHLTAALLRQAKNNGLVEIKQYLKLKNTYNLITQICSKDPYKKLDKKNTFIVNSAIEEMFEELYKIF